MLRVLLLSTGAAFAAASAVSCNYCFDTTYQGALFAAYCGSTDTCASSTSAAGFSCPSECTVNQPLQTSTSYGCATSYATTSCNSNSNNGLTVSDIGVDEVESAKKAVTAGVTASVIIGVLLGAGIVASAYFSPCNTPASPAMTAWKPRAASAFTLLAAGTFFLALGLLIGLAGPAIPWFSIGASASYNTYVSSYAGYAGLTFTAITIAYTDSTGNSVIVNDPYTAAGAGIAYFGLIVFIFPALILSWLALCRVSAVVKYGSAPPAGCGGGMPTIQGLSWVGLVVFL